MIEGPPISVVAAFGADEKPVPLQGGQGSAWRLGNVVVKPAEISPDELAWQADLFENLPGDAFRLSRPIRSRDNRFVVEGWSAWETLEGRHLERHWLKIIAVGEAFHHALRGVSKPAFLAKRRDPWAIGDRVAWGDLPMADFSGVKHISRLAEALHPIQAESQLIHGDLTGNVLFADGLPPAIIDFSPYWRPPAFASAIVVADALIWEGADGSLIDSLGHIEQFEQHLLRALIYRAVTDRLFRDKEPLRSDDADPYLPAVDLACRLAGA